MAKIELFKNEELVLTKTGLLENEYYIFDNIKYDFQNNILVREDDNFKYCLDFKENSAEIIIKENNYNLDLKINVINILIDDNFHEITYNIESEDVIKNKIIITR